MNHQDEYFDNLVTMLELIWGEGYMTPGGSDNVEKMLDGIETAGKRILDIGCGIGGQAFEMVNTFGADVVGIDLEAPLIKRATEAATKMGLQDRCKFHAVKAGALDFPDQSFDIVATSAAITQVKDKANLFGECYRVLKPGGYLTCYDWTKSEEPLSEDMFYWFKMEGLTFALETLEEYKANIKKIGYIEVIIKPWIYMGPVRYNACVRVRAEISIMSDKLFWGLCDFQKHRKKSFSLTKTHVTTFTNPSPVAE